MLLVRKYLFFFLFLIKNDYFLRNEFTPPNSRDRKESIYTLQKIMFPNFISFCFSVEKVLCKHLKISTFKSGDQNH